MTETVTESATDAVTETGRAPRPEKVAIVDEIASKLAASEAVFVSEYRGLTVGHLANLRGALRPSDAEHKVYKNTLARLAVRTAGADGLEELLVGPTAITFVRGDIAAAAKALRDTSRTNPLLVLKGGALGAKLLTADDIRSLADLPSRDELLAQIAGAFQAPLVKLASLLQALPRNFAYGLAALIDQRGGVPAEDEAVSSSESEPVEAVSPSEPEPVEAVSSSESEPVEAVSPSEPEPVEAVSSSES
ncbi:MAG TPA: 50S ribosomal protein L10, partial [Ilumatobacteraceae bacterium]|nr:50S ribosomal protein L10 [Ilumatobacteraceae bacterium]